MSKIFTSSIIGLDGVLVEVESDIARGLPTFNIVGLPDASVKESKDRVRSAIKNSGFDFPIIKTTVNMAPADIKKEGSLYDLPIALSILIANGSIPDLDEPILFLGELSLDGRLRGVSGVISCALLARAKGIKKIIVPEENAKEAALAGECEVYEFKNLRDVVGFLRKEIAREPFYCDYQDFWQSVGDVKYDFKDIKGQQLAKYALEIVASGGHNLFFSGPPGAGKTLLAKSIISILPRLTFEEAIEVSRIYSVSGLLKSGEPLVKERPFRSPHHTASSIALIGGGSSPRPGEISLAHRGVLFLDEMPEFSRHVLESLRQPLEDGAVVVSRIAAAVSFPAKFILIAAQNPCPCGNYGNIKVECVCQPLAIEKYKKRISGPLLDRIDMHLSVPAMDIEAMEALPEAESSAVIREKVEKCRKIQGERFAGEGIFTNSEMNAKQIECFGNLSGEAKARAIAVSQRLNLSVRAYHRLLKVARTIADLEEVERIEDIHIARASQFRVLER